MSKNNIQYRIDSHDILFSDLINNQRVKITHSLFNEVSNELRDRLNDKKFAKKKIEFAEMKKDDLPKANNILKGLVMDDLIPTVAYKINDTLTKNDISLTLGGYTALISNLVNHLTYNFLKMYPKPMREILAQTLVIDIDYGMSRLIEAIEKDLKLDPVTEEDNHSFKEMMKDPERAKKYTELINQKQQEEFKNE
jgi:hypothetical protein